MRRVKNEEIKIECEGEEKESAHIEKKKKEKKKECEAECSNSRFTLATCSLKESDSLLDFTKFLSNLYGPGHRM